MDGEVYKWWVPLTYTTQQKPDFGKTRPMAWMKDTAAQISLSSLPNSDQWLVVNLQQAGFYRVNYDDNNWKLITQQLVTDHSVIHVINRAQILDDSFNLARAGKVCLLCRNTACR